MPKNDLSRDLQVLRRYYDYVRIIDADNIHSTEDVETHLLNYGECLQCDLDVKECKRCPVVRTVRTGKTFIGFKTVNEENFVVMAMPRMIDERLVAVELIKNIGEEPQQYISTAEYMNLNKMTIKDALTGAYNRRFLDRQLPLEMLKIQKNKQSGSIVMADIDYFKRINDQYGHLIGDDVLKRFVKQLQQNIRCDNGDWVARYGGEEFFIFLKNCPERSAYYVAEKLRKKIENLEFTSVADDLRVTASFGVHSITEEDKNLSEIINTVDKLMYRAKQVGRNCTVDCKKYSSDAATDSS